MDDKKDVNTETLIDFLENIQGGVILCNYNTVTCSSEVIYTNKEWKNITGYSTKQLRIEKNGNPQSLVLTKDKDAINKSYEDQLRKGTTYELMYRIMRHDGSIRWIIDKGTTTTLDNGIIQNKSIITDVTKIKEQEEYMTTLARIDQLTNLNNKTTFTLLAQSYINQHNKSQSALLMLDIDSFKNINDTQGHGFGDLVLKAVAMQMKMHFRTSDILGRIGGDEFMVLMTNVANKNDVVNKTKALCDAIRGIEISNYNQSAITISIGVSYHCENKSYETMFTEADKALYKAKARGKDQCVFANWSDDTTIK